VASRLDEQVARETGDEPTAEQRPTCRCGHDRKHHMVSPKKEYSFWGWVLLVMGVTAKPVRIRYVCRVCDQIFDRQDFRDPT